jgi:hypothetical protein
MFKMAGFLLQIILAVITLGHIIIIIIITIIIIATILWHESKRFIIDCGCYTLTGRNSS